MESPKRDDYVALAVGVALWAGVIPVVKFSGELLKDGNQGHKAGMMALTAFTAFVTTPILSRALGWTTREMRLRGIAVALGAAQVMDGLVHLLLKDFYSSNPVAAHYSSGTVFFGAGLTGILSALT